MNDHASHYFARGNTAFGAHFLYQSAFRGLDKILVLSGPPGTGKSTVIRHLADALLETGQRLQCFHSPLRPEELDGFIAPDLKAGVVDGGESQGIPADEAGEVLRFNFGEAVEGRISSDDAEAIAALQQELDAAYAQAYAAFLAALRIHDEWETYYIESMDFEKADQVAQELIRELFDGKGSGTPTAGRHLFFGAATPQGAYDFIPGLTAQLDRRIFIKGRPGSGKSTMLKKLAAAAEQSGIEVQVFHCGFDPNSLDMLIFPKLSTAIFDSTAPHEYFPVRDGDEILDMYDRAMTPGTDETYASELSAIKERYSAKMKEATSLLAQAEALDSRIKAIYAAAADFTIVGGLRRQLQSELENLQRVSL